MPTKKSSPNDPPVVIAGPPGLVTVLNSIAVAIGDVANSVRPHGTCYDAGGDFVDSLTGAGAAIANGLYDVADAIRELATAVRHQK